MQISPLARKIIVVGLVMFSVLAPLLWWISAGADLDDKLLIQRNGLCLLFVYILISEFWIERAAKQSKNDLIVAVIFLVAAASLLVRIHDFAKMPPNHDFMFIVQGAVNVLLGFVPYKAEEYALYPPLYAQIIAASFRNVESIADQFGIVLNQRQILHVVYYLFQNLQMLGVVTLLYLSNKFARSICRFGKMEAAILVCGALTLSFSVFKTLEYTQVNIFLSCILFFALTFASRMDSARGFAIALGTFIKVYPILLIPPLLVSRQWKVCLWTAIWAVPLLSITLIGYGPQVWTAWSASVHNFIHMTNVDAPVWFYDAGNSFATVALITKYLPAIGFHQLSSLEISRIATGFKCVIGIWFLWRYIQRHRRHPTGNASWLRRLNLYDDACDFLSFGLIAGPTAIQEQYVMALPIILWTIATNGKRTPFLVMLGTLMAFGFKVFGPLAPVGLCLLAYARLAVANRPESVSAQEPAELNDSDFSEVAELANTSPQTEADQGFVSNGLTTGAASGGTLSG